MATVYAVLHVLLVAAYVAAPVAAVAVSARRRGREARPATEASARLATLGTFVAGTAMGVSLSVVYAVAVKGRVSVPQALLAAYFATALMLLLKAADALMRRAAFRLSLRRELLADGSTVAVRLRRGVAMATGVVRVLILFGLGLPFVMAAVVSYRPKVLPLDDPRSQLGFTFETVTFRATDGTRLAGWWIPAQDGSGRLNGDATRTVILCHGLGSNKSNQLVLCRKLVPAGFNVLAIDHRAHGESGGQLTSFGDLERRDVLGAIRWLRAERSAQAETVFGVGASQGAAALIAAAADASDEGRAIEAVAVYGTFDDLGRLADSLARKTFLPPLNWLVEWSALPIASAHSGADLRRFRPAELAPRLWPRPLLVIHGVQDQIIDFAHGRALFEQATQPKLSLWIERGDHNSIVNSDEAAEAVLLFFQTARPRPLI